VWRTASSRVLVIVSAVLLLVSGLVAGARSSPDPLDPTRWTSALRATPSAQPLRNEITTERTLVSDDFHADPVGANPPAGWELSGAWQGVTEDGGHVLSHAPGSGLGTLLTGSPGWSDYQVAVDVRVTTPRSGFAGLVARWQTGGDYYECVIHQDESVKLWRVRNGQGVELGATQLPIDLGRTHRLALALDGSRLTCSLDWATLATATDGALSAGRPGLVASSGEAAEFDNVSVTTRVPARGQGSTPAGEGSTPAPGASASVPAIPTPAGTPAPTAAPPTPSASPPPAAGPPAIVRAPRQAARGAPASVVVHTTPGATCALSLINPLVAAQATGVGPQTADAQGNVRWNWNVGARTPRGQVPVAIACGGQAVQTTVNVV
jgi:hypothetical protein